MRVEISNGHVILRDKVHRAAARAYNDALFTRAEMTETGTAKLNPADIDRAVEALLGAMALKIVVKTGEVEEAVEMNQAWLDELEEADFKTLTAALLKLKNGAKETAKK